MGIETLLIDILDISETINSLDDVLNIGNINLLVKDVKELTDSDIYKKPNIIFSQRFIQYLKYEEAKGLMATIARSTSSRARIFISASGLHSELGQDYEHKGNPIEKRYCKLHSTMAEKHHIREPVCLYTEGEMKELLEPFGFSLLKIWSSSFGNIKAVFDKNE